MRNTKKNNLLIRNINHPDIDFYNVFVKDGNADKTKEHIRRMKEHLKNVKNGIKLTPENDELTAYINMNKESLNHSIELKKEIKKNNILDMPIVQNDLFGETSVGERHLASIKEMLNKKISSSKNINSNSNKNI
jgi:hypothetical protein